MAAEEVEVKADIFWNLPALVSYRPGTELPCSISAANLDEEERLFMLKVRTFDRSGRVITEDVILVNGMSWFEVFGGERQDVEGSIVLGETEVTLGVFLVERETSGEIDAIYTYLQGY
jgi:hypothetical protein